MAYKDFQAAQVLTAQEVDEYLMRQSVMVFATASARDLAIASPTEGMLVYLNDSNILMMYDGSAWIGIASSTVRSDPNGADGGIVMRPWTGNPAITSIATHGMIGQEYILGSNGTTTYISGGVGGRVEIYPGNNDSSASVTVEANSVRVNGRLTTPQQPYCRLAGAGANWFQPGATRLANGTPSGFSWAVMQNVGNHFNAGTGLFIAPVTGVYLCTFQTYQQTYGGVSWIHWMWELGGSITWNNGDGAYNIFGYFSGNYADGVGTTVMVEVGAGNGIAMRGIMGGDERFYSNYTYMSIRLLG